MSFEEKYILKKLNYHLIPDLSNMVMEYLTIEKWLLQYIYHKCRCGNDEYNISSFFYLFAAPAGCC